MKQRIKVSQPAIVRAAEANIRFNRSMRGAVRPNLAYHDLTGLDLTGLDLSGVDLTGACLHRVLAKGANLSGANLFGADLRVELAPLAPGEPGPVWKAA